MQCKNYWKNTFWNRRHHGRILVLNQLSISSVHNNVFVVSNSLSMYTWRGQNKAMYLKVWRPPLPKAMNFYVHIFMWSNHFTSGGTIGKNITSTKWNHWKALRVMRGADKRAGSVQMHRTRRNPSERNYGGGQCLWEH